MLVGMEKTRGRRRLKRVLITLAVPPLAPSTVDKDGTRAFDLRVQTGSTEFRPGVATPTWGFNGGHLGPTLRAERGEWVKVRVRNTLDEASSVHWHGMHLPVAMDRIQLSPGERRAVPGADRGREAAGAGASGP